MAGRGRTTATGSPQPFCRCVSRNIARYRPAAFLAITHMPDNKLKLVVEVDVDRANASIKGINKGLSSFEQAARNAARGASQGIDGFTLSVGKGVAAGAVLASAFEEVPGWIKEVGVETAKYAARTEALTVVTDQLARERLQRVLSAAARGARQNARHLHAGSFVWAAFGGAASCSA